jgi:hypothetical protein
MGIILLLLLSSAEELNPTVIPKDIELARLEMQGLSLGQRMKVVTTPLLGRDYSLGPTGEGYGYDPDPIVRYDAFDCLTFVEEAMALSLGESQQDIDRIRQDLRYKDAQVAYDNRNHFMLSQWIPNNIKKGYFQDITHTLGETHFVSKQITEKTWSRWKGRHRYPFEITQYPTGVFSMGVLSIDAVIAAIPKLPEGALLIVVRTNYNYNPILITHLGFVVHHSKTNIRIRHATKMSGGKVQDSSLYWYLEHIRKYTRWPIDGILVLMPQELRQSTLP